MILPSWPEPNPGSCPSSFYPTLSLIPDIALSANRVTIEQAGFTGNCYFWLNHKYLQSLSQIYKALNKGLLKLTKTAGTRALRAPQRPFGPILRILWWTNTHTHTPSILYRCIIFSIMSKRNVDFLLCYCTIT